MGKCQIKTVKTLLRAMDEGDETLPEFCRKDDSPENQQRILTLITRAIKLGFVNYAPGPSVTSPDLVTYRLTATGRKKVQNDEMLSRHGAKDLNTGMSRGATQIIAAAMKSQPSSIFGFATFLR